ncbi:Type II secretion system (T2SS), protein F [Thermoactinomyces sp. DSM 45891]|nr:Type II secretion system (T2SS), protein F [Thermoactinomyces sp. DSM 45891]
MMWQRSNWTFNQLAQFSGQLRHLLQCGVPLVTSIELLIQQKVLSPSVGRSVTNHLEQGASFSKALQKSHLPPFMVSLVAAAEQYGDYERGLKQCEQFYQTQAKITQDIRQACTYPAIVMVLVIASFIFLLSTVLPRFEELYTTMGLELPWLTKMLFTLTDIAGIVLPIIGTMLMVLIGLLVYLGIRSPKQMRSYGERLSFRVFGLRAWMKFRVTHYLALQLGSLLHSGVPLLQAIECLHLRAPWRIIAVRIGFVRDALLEGKTLEQACEEYLNLYTIPTFTQYIAIAERTGKLDQTLQSLAGMVEATMKQQIERFTKLLEPVLISCLGFLLALAVLALFLPMLQMVQSL